MKNIIIFSGTTEGRELSEKLAAAGIAHMVSVATKYGELVMTEHPLVKIHNGRLTAEEMIQLLCRQQIEIVVDATHPYAIEVTRTIRACVESLAAKDVEIQYLRLKRNLGKEEGLRLFNSNEACRDALEQVQGNILLTTGSKNLPVYCKSAALRNRLYVRVLPGVESLGICTEQGLHPSQILALQGPFSVEMNLAFIRQYQISCMVSKQGGTNGGFPEKKEACEQAGIPLYVIQRENSEEEKSVSYNFMGICGRLEEMLGVKINCETQAKLNMTLAGVGMGSLKSLTLEAAHMIQGADFIAGAKRVIEPFTPRLEKKNAYTPEEIMEWLREMSIEYANHGELQAAILFSGDSGFYSGCQKVRDALKEALEKDYLQGTVRTCPGISSVQAMAAVCEVSWQDAGIYSIHGRNKEPGWEKTLLNKIRQHETLFLLVSGAEDVRMIGKLLENEENFKIHVGYQISYPEEEIQLLTPIQCKDVKKEGLYSICIQQSHFEKKFNSSLTHGLNDSEFVRGKVPMTKEEVREAVICKLHVCKKSVCYDIGSGTGSIAVETARLHSSVRVYAIEQKPEALELLNKNREKFRCDNMEVVEGTAPAAMANLEAPTHAFIGGTCGHLMEILQCLYEKNPTMRVVLTAISLETAAEFALIEKKYQVENFEMIQMQVNRYQKLGAYQMAKAENPIVICSFNFIAGNPHERNETSA